MAKFSKENGMSKYALIGNKKRMQKPLDNKRLFLKKLEESDITCEKLKNRLHFLQEMYHILDYHKIAIKFEPEKYENVLNGYFSSIKKCICLTQIDNLDNYDISITFRILIHEFSHFLQHLEGNDFIEDTKFENVGKILEYSNIASYEKHFENLKKCELDAARRVLSFNRIYDLGFSEELYTKIALIYITSIELSKCMGMSLSAFFWKKQIELLEYVTADYEKVKKLDVSINYDSKLFQEMKRLFYLHH